MPLPEDSFYEIATKEVATNRLAASIWGRAYSESDGDSARAKAAYIRLRAAQLTQLFSESSTEEYLRELWPEIKVGELFMCPTCKRVSQIKVRETPFFRKLISNVPSRRYCCGICNDELATERGMRQESSSGRISPRAATSHKSNSAWASIGFAFGLISIFFYFVGIIPILAIVSSGIGLATFDESRQKNRWMAFAGLALGAVYTIMMLNHHGHLK